ncbi:hypothetical protein HO173_007513 [Letharia columbiana]|uniref:Uncharacterized protein n=1 Tax=Letharia columbiana TaxID=112416 RepID=A0A8H6L3H2_9LECA|nr:uncharacterized protein HO173_007513 [Letharia columbiana]KAF6234094.1 hypothetical protein HO173_007513 [Letharia columbiana]
MLFPLQTLTLISAISAAVLQPLQSINNPLLTTNGSEIFLFSNATNATASVPAELGTAIARCSASKYGSNLNVASCQNAFESVQSDDHYSSFGLRHHGAHYNGVLPFMWLSGT